MVLTILREIMVQGAIIKEATIWLVCYKSLLFQQTVNKKVSYYDILVLRFLGFYNHDVNKKWTEHKDQD